MLLSRVKAYSCGKLYRKKGEKIADSAIIAKQENIVDFQHVFSVCDNSQVAPH